MKQYQVLIRKDNGNEEVILIDANNENDARWEGKKIFGVYQAVVLRRNISDSKYFIDPKDGLNGIQSIFSHFK